MTWKWTKSMVSLLSLLVVSACQANYGNRHRPAEGPTPDSIPSNSSPIKHSDGSSCTVNSSPQSIAFLPLPDSLPATQIQTSHPVGTNLGIGFLVERRGDHSDAHTPEWNPGYEWLHHLRLPLYDAPNGQAWGWLACGWLVDLSSPTPQMSQLEPSLLQTSYETLSFIVLQEQPDGWFQLRYSAPLSSHQGIAWAHTSHLELGDRPLIIQYWKDLFQPRDLQQVSHQGWLHFRDDVPSTYLRLRNEPTTTSPVIFPTDEALLQGEYGVEPLEIQGNWMRVRVSFPQDYCVASSQAIEFHDGWMQWWTPEQGTLLYYSTRGC